MRWNEDALYQQFLRRDVSLNGKFLTGVLTTGIYCLPSCPARRPKRENVRFFRSPDEARRHGLRPCHRCRPDFFYCGTEWYESLYEQTAARVVAEPSAFQSVASLGTAAGLSRTAANDLFRDHGHESPAAFLRRIRVEHVCRLLQQGEKPAAAAAEAGFESASSFHELFVARTGLTPGSYASLGASLGAANHFTLRLPAHYRSREVLDYFGRDPDGVSERATADGFRKCFLCNGRAAVIDTRFDGDLAHCETDAADVFEAHRIALRMLGFGADTSGFERKFAGRTWLGALIAQRRGLRIPLTPDWWEALAWAIVGQQINLPFAVSLRRALILAAGEAHTTGLRAHPTPERVAQMSVDLLRRMKFSGSKAEYLLAAARAIANRELALGAGGGISARRAARLLSEIRGVGPWTVEYVLLRGLGFGDCVPAGDAGVAQGLERATGERPGEARIRELMADYAPWRSLATCHVWASLKGEER